MSFEFQINRGSAPTEREAAALIAAIELFLQDTSVPAGEAAGSHSTGWLRAALHEGVGMVDPDRIWE